ncbi:hypothetical protein Tco_0087987 [Tanacetum coccineum]
MLNNLSHSVISSASIVTYTSVYTNSEPWRVFWGANEELSDGGSSLVIVYGYNGLPMQPVAPPSLDYVPGPKHPPSLDYVPGPEHPPLPIEVPYMPEPEYPGYLVPSDDEAPMEDQPLPADASPTALSSGYVDDSDSEEDPEEDPEEDHADYPADGGDDDDEPFDDDNDDDDTDDEDEEASNDEEEEEHLAPTNSSTVPAVNPVPLAGYTDAFETDESAPTPISPQTKVLFSQTRLRRARKTVRLEPPMSPSMEARIAEYAAAPTPPSPPPSLLSPWEDILKAELPPRKRLCLTAPTSRDKVGESLTASPRPTGGYRVDYGFIGTLDVDLREAVEEVAPTIIKGVNARVTEIASVQEQDTQDIYAMIEDAQDRQTQLSQRDNILIEDRQFHQETALLLDHEALASREAWLHSVGLSPAVHYKLQAYRTHTWIQDHRIASQESLATTLITQISSLQGQLSAALGQIQALQARDQTHADDPKGADSSDYNNMPPKRTSTAARATADVAAALMTAAAIKQLIKAIVSVALSNQETLRNSTNGHGDGSHNSGTGTRGTTRTPRECTYKDFLNCQPNTFKGIEGVVVLAQWFEKMESVFHISNCAMKNQVKFATCSFLRNALTWWNSHMKTVTQDVAYAMDWKTLKKMMTIKYYPRGEIKKLEIKF